MIGLIVLPMMFLLLFSKFTFVDVQASNRDLEGDIDLLSLYPKYMEMDLYVPGNVLVVDDRRLITIDFKRAKADIIVGCESCAGSPYREGTGEHAAFSSINSFYQHNSTHVIIADTGNDCLRLVSRITRATSTLIGPCGDDDYGRLSVDGDFQIARIGSPKSVIRLPANDDQYDVSFTDFGDIRGIDITNQQVNTMSKDAAYILNSLTVHPDNQNLYFTFQNDPHSYGKSSGVGKMDLQTYGIDIISSGRDSTSSSSAFSMQDFGNLNQLIFLSENVMLMADSVKSLIFVVDLAQDSISSICQPPPMKWNDLKTKHPYQSCVKFTTSPGSISECKICNPSTLLAINECDEILVGSISGLSYINIKGMDTGLVSGSSIKACKIAGGLPDYIWIAVASIVGALLIVGLVIAIVRRNQIRDKIKRSVIYRRYLNQTGEQPYGEMRDGLSN